MENTSKDREYKLREKRGTTKKKTEGVNKEKNCCKIFKLGENAILRRDLEAVGQLTAVLKIFKVREICVLFKEKREKKRENSLSYSKPKTQFLYIDIPLKKKGRRRTLGDGRKRT
ncbi:hypothetical protein NPIL_305771 [Nephila pilipes]|uniref:Uncharacterized protein n=1 Tax=Nephila pilipes TaxID=299642 RepID=A0A8X6Q7W1_NEPPI|nr:hypothetical protein NPIL_305771 [Nephila pilipes]